MTRYLLKHKKTLARVDVSYFLNSNEVKLKPLKPTFTSIQQIIIIINKPSLADEWKSLPSQTAGEQMGNYIQRVMD